MKKTLLTIAAAICAVSISFAASPVIKYAGEVNVGFATGGKLRTENTATKSSLHRPFIETIHGVSITKYAFVGAGLGLQGYFGAVDTDVPEEKWDTLALPLFGNLKGQLPLKAVTPYIGLNASADIVGVKAESRLTGGFYCDCGAGVKLFNNKVNIGIGMQHQQMGTKLVVTDGSYSETERSDDYTHGTSFYVKVGFAW